MQLVCRVSSSFCLCDFPWCRADQAGLMEMEMNLKDKGVWCRELSVSGENRRGLGCSPLQCLILLLFLLLVPNLTNEHKPPCLCSFGWEVKASVPYRIDSCNQSFTPTVWMERQPRLSSISEPGAKHSRQTQIHLGMQERQTSS